MGRHFVISLMASNRVGILAAVTNALAELGGDLQEATQTVLNNRFAMMLLAAFPEGRTPDVILEHFRGVCRPFDAVIDVKEPTRNDFANEESVAAERYYLSGDGRDTPGILRKLSVRLAEEGVDITNLFATRDEAGGACRMLMELSVPNCVDTENLRDSLGVLCEAVGLDASLDHESEFRIDGMPMEFRSLPASWYSQIRTPPSV